MLLNDLHIHSIRSQCGTMTYAEIVARARELGMHGVAITDHALAFGEKRFHFHILTKRYPREVDGIRVYKGIELNVVDAEGTVDMPMELLAHFDYVALGMHPVRGCLADLGLAGNTDALLAALRLQPWIDAVVHPTQRSHPLDFARILPVMAELDVAFEVNGCGHQYRKADPRVTADALGYAVERGVPVVANSDAHVFSEIGEDSSIREVFRLAGLDPELAVNASDASVEALVARGREQRLRTAEGGG